MLTLLSQYLVRHRMVAIPSVGSFLLNGIPARFDFGDKLMLPPGEELVIMPADAVPEEQYAFLAQKLDTDLESVKSQLETFGRKFRKRIAEGDVEWNGFGILSMNNNELRVKSEIPNFLLPVPAIKVLREGAEHTIRRGEDQVRSTLQQPVGRKRLQKFPMQWLAWLLIILAAAAIVFIFYRNGYRISASGLQQKVAMVQYR